MGVVAGGNGDDCLQAIDGFGRRGGEVRLTAGGAETEPDCFPAAGSTVIVVDPGCPPPAGLGVCVYHRCPEGCWGCSWFGSGRWFCLGHSGFKLTLPADPESVPIF